MKGPVALLYAGYVLIGIPGGAFGVAWPSVADDLGRSVSELGVAIAAFTIGFVAAGVFFGRIDRVTGRGNLLVMGGVVTAVATLGFAAAPAWWLLLAATVGIGVGEGLLEAGYNSYAASHHGARLMNWAHAGFAFGAVLGPLLVTGLIAAGGDWRAAFGAVAVANGLMSVALWFTRDRWPVAQVAAGAPSASAPSSRPAGSRGLLWAALVMFFIYTGVEVTAGSWSFTLFTEERGIGEEAAGLLMSAFFAVFMAARIVVGAIGDRVAAERVVQLSMAAATMLALLYWLSPAAWLGAVALLGLGIAYAAIFPMLMVLTPVRLGEALAARAIGYQLAAAGLGVAAISGGAGLVVEAAGLESVGAILFVGSALLWVVGEVSSRMPASAGAPSPHEA